MILPFSTQINGKKTHFPEKILLGIQQNNLSEEPLIFGLASKDFKPKLHTIREDKTDRWKPGVQIDFFINARQKNMFRFAPRIPVVSVQKIKIVHFLAEAHIYIDDSFYGEIFFNGNKEIDGYAVNIEELAINDGFDDAEDFIAYFNKDFTGKIIHWTNLKY